jgi:metal-responsive CopG/Arc/MetJ family transcriptional regulator
MKGTKTTKHKVSITLAPALLRAVDAAAKKHSDLNRSAIIERWLRRAARMELEDQLRDETIAYYESLSREERREDVVIARAASRAARRLEIEDD